MDAKSNLCLCSKAQWMCELHMLVQDVLDPSEHPTKQAFWRLVLPPGAVKEAMLDGL